MKIRIERRLVDDLVPYVQNSKRHTEDDLKAIAASIKRFGFNDPIGITPEGVIVEGHGRWTAAQRLGLEDVPVLVIEGLSEADYDLYRIAHNKIAQTSHFDFAALTVQLKELVSGDGDILFEHMGFDGRIVATMFSHFTEDEEGGDITSRAASNHPLAYEIIWDSKEDKSSFAKFLANEVAGGADKSMEGELLLEAIRRVAPDIFQQLTAAVPDMRTLDQIAGATEEQTHA